MINLHNQQWYKISPYYLKKATETLVGDENRLATLHSLLEYCLHLDGEVWECGTYKGGTAVMMAHIINDINPNIQLRLFDTFTGLPESNIKKDEGNWKGMFSDTSAKFVYDKVSSVLTNTTVHEGLIPDTFSGLESSKIIFAHIDLDLYDGYMASLNFIWPRLVPGGIIVFDDYGFCPGAKKAVNEFFKDKKVKHSEILDSIQALVIKPKNYLLMP